MDRSKLLGKEKITRLLLKFSVPSIIGMLVSALYNVVDSFFVGNYVGQIGLTAVSFAMPVMIIQMAIGFMVAIGALTLISIRLGEKLLEEAERIMNCAVALSIVLGIIVNVLSVLFLEPMLKAFGAEASALPYTYAFTFTIMFGSLFQYVGWGMNAFMRGEGNPRMSMIVMLVSAVINAILNPTFIVLCGLGIVGSALATVVTQLITTIIGIMYFRSNRSIMKLKLSLLRIPWDCSRKIIANGMPQFLIQTASGLVVIIYNAALLKYGGDVAVAAGGVVNRIAMLFLMPIFGINQGAQPIFGFNYGARHFKRVLETLRKAIIFAVIVATIGFVMTRTMPELMVKIFCNDPTLVKEGAHGLLLNLFFLPFIGYQIISSMFFQAIGKPKISSALTLSRQMIILIPALLIIPQIYGLDGVWLSGPVADMTATLLTTVMIIRETRSLRKKQAKRDAEEHLEDIPDLQMPDTRAI